MISIDRNTIFVVRTQEHLDFLFKNIPNFTNMRITELKDIDSERISEDNPLGVRIRAKSNTIPNGYMTLKRYDKDFGYNDYLRIEVRDLMRETASELLKNILDE